jgi:hypothetical protein
MRGLAAADIDGDGREDILINQQDGPPRLLLNRLPGGNWLGVRLKGPGPNRDAIGATVTVTSRGRPQAAAQLAGDSYLSSSSAVLHFGLGAAGRAEAVRVVWPNGVVQTLKDVTCNQLLVLEAPSAR